MEKAIITIASLTLLMASFFGGFLGGMSSVPVEKIIQEARFQQESQYLQFAVDTYKKNCVEQNNPGVGVIAFVSFNGEHASFACPKK